MKTIDKVIRYYDESEDGYRDVWNLDDSRQLNLGLWEEGIPNLKSALKNLNDRLAEISGIDSDSRILDIGCGVGGSAIYLSEKTGATFTGLNINSRQIERARKHAEDSAAARRLRFCKGDFHNLPFKDESFDFVMAIETLCHAYDITEVFSEVSRVLKKGGTFIFAETLRSKENLSDKEEIVLYDRAFKGCQVDHLYYPEELKERLLKTGLDPTDVRDWSSRVEPSVRRLKRISYLGKIYNFWKERTGSSYSDFKKGNTLLASGLYPAMRKKLWGYYMFKAEKR